jgi:hypothetical protein
MRHQLRVPSIIVIAVGLAACGGSSAGGVASIVPAAGAFGQQSAQTATVQIEVPLAQTAASVTSRTPQYVAPQTSFFLVDLQGVKDTQFQNTLFVDATHCANGTGVQTCTYTINIPAGDPTSQKWSIAAGAGSPFSPSGPPLSVVHNYSPCGFPSCTGGVVISVWLDAVVADITNVSFGFGWPPPGYYPSGSGQATPYFTFTPVDAYGNVVFGRFGTNAPLDSWGFENPITLTDDDRSGELTVAAVIQIQPLAIIADTLVAPVTFTTLANPHAATHAMAIIDNATQSRTMNITYAVPKVELKPSEFPQLRGVWSSPARTGTLLTVTCMPASSVSAGTSPCVQPGGTGTVIIH